MKHTENSNTVQKKLTKQQKQYNTKLKQHHTKQPTPKQDGQQLANMTVNLHGKPRPPHLQQISLFSSVEGYASLNSILALTCLLLAVTNVNQTLIIIFDNGCNLFKPYDLQCINVIQTYIIIFKASEVESNLLIN